MELSRQLTGTGVNGNILAFSMRDDGQGHGSWSQNICGFLGEARSGGDLPEPNSRVHLVTSWGHMKGRKVNK